MQVVSQPPNEIIKQIINQLGVVIASKLVPIATIFLYSRMMSVPDFGLLNLFQSYLWIFTITLSLNLHIAVGRYIYLPEAAFESFLGTSLISVGAIFTAGSIVVVMFADATSVMLGIPQTLLPLMLVIVFGQIAESIMTQITIHDKRGGLLLKIVAGKAIFSLGLSLSLLFVWREDKFLAVILADGIANLVLSAVVLFLLRSRVVWTLKWDHLLYIARYALPLAPYMLAMTLLSQFDRVIIDRIYGGEATGLYSLSYNVGALLLLIATAILNAFNPSFFAALNRCDYDRVKKDARTVFSIALVSTVAIVLFGQWFASLVLPVSYSEGFALIPIVAFGGLCSIVFQIWVRVLAFFHKTATISGIATGCAAVNILLNLWLLPLFGWQIAAWTTVLAYLGMSLACLIAINIGNLMPTILPWREALWICFVLVLVCIALWGQLTWLMHLGILLIVVWFVRHELLALLMRESK